MKNSNPAALFPEFVQEQSARLQAIQDSNHNPVFNDAQIERILFQKKSLKIIDAVVYHASRMINEFLFTPEEVCGLATHGCGDLAISTVSGYWPVLSDKTRDLYLTNQQIYNIVTQSGGSNALMVYIQQFHAMTVKDTPYRLSKEDFVKMLSFRGNAGVCGYLIRHHAMLFQCGLDIKTILDIVSFDSGAYALSNLGDFYTILRQNQFTHVQILDMVMHLGGGAALQAVRDHLEELLSFLSCEEITAIASIDTASANIRTLIQNRPVLMQAFADNRPELISILKKTNGVPLLKKAVEDYKTNPVPYRRQIKSKATYARKTPKPSRKKILQEANDFVVTERLQQSLALWKISQERFEREMNQLRAIRFENPDEPALTFLQIQKMILKKCSEKTIRIVIECIKELVDSLGFTPTEITRIASIDGGGVTLKTLMTHFERLTDPNRIGYTKAQLVLIAVNGRNQGILRLIEYYDLFIARGFTPENIYQIACKEGSANAFIAIDVHYNFLKERFTPKQISGIANQSSGALAILAVVKHYSFLVDRHGVEVQKIYDTVRRTNGWKAIEALVYRVKNCPERLEESPVKKRKTEPDFEWEFSESDELQEDLLNVEDLKVDPVLMGNYQAGFFANQRQGVQLEEDLVQFLYESMDIEEPGL